MNFAAGRRSVGIGAGACLMMPRRKYGAGAVGQVADMAH